MKTDYRDANQKRRHDQRLEVRIVVKRHYDGRCEIFVYDPQTNREIHTGLTVRGRQVEEEVKKLARQFQRAGNSVQVVDKER